jgi:hypothetical protein
MGGIDSELYDMDLLNRLLGDRVSMLSGEYETLSLHWEAWTLPNFYHPVRQLNLKTIDMINDLAK